MILGEKMIAIAKVVYFDTSVAEESPEDVEALAHEISHIAIGRTRTTIALRCSPSAYAVLFGKPLLFPAADVGNVARATRAPVADELATIATSVVVLRTARFLVDGKHVPLLEALGGQDAVVRGACAALWNDPHASVQSGRAARLVDTPRIYAASALAIAMIAQLHRRLEAGRPYLQTIRRR